MRANLKSMLAAGFVAAAMGLTASAAPVTISSLSNSENGASYVQGPGGAFVFTSGTGYDFTGQPTLTSITDITVTLTISDGDSDALEPAEGHLHLYLDGIDTGLVLDGFSGGAQIVTLTLNTINPSTQAALLAALADGHLVGSVFQDQALAGVGSIGFPAITHTFLDITGNQGAGTIGGGGGPAGVPLPAAAVLAPLGAGLAGVFARRFRRAAK